jgi:hypothetical protein
MQIRIDLRAALRFLVVVVFVGLCILTVWQPQRWLFLFGGKSLRTYLLFVAIFILYGLSRKR